MFASHLLGAQGEQIAARYLQENGYDILQKNCKLGHEEIDIVAHDTTENMIVFVEVKTRSRLSPLYPARTSITRRKRAAMRRAMYKWMEQQRHEASVRLDLIAVSRNQVVEHLKDLGSEFLI